MPECYTCHEEIIFDRNVRSKTGKQIPLWPDGLNTHSHDEQGQPIRGELPVDYKPKPQAVASTFQPKPFKPGAWRNNQQLDNTKTVTSTDTDVKIDRLIAQQFEINQKLAKLIEKVEYNTQVDTDKLVGQLQQIHDVIAPFLGTQLKTGKELLNESQEQKYKREQEEQTKWKIPDDPNFSAEDEVIGEGADTE